ncbi:Coenzyme F420 hydrogenase/dehydrogenase, beta subunit C-terminal domain [Clostridium frigoris]|uniref:Coenzyme F420 hydrogenase/dehydrogenase, beta subunit C-terminal domain n=1 Tax=Clostridium frigoris TaxID=205327 RepID=A0ABS6BSF8_9CLOT|nr:Coenzyme F420 hydrogenase/dehydrogenase, beta subunit C-terminal domain [Clostridium frigoris]MBU3159860.1 Coenzyme F420 hydrogenase/dehydrogenase, beta subunit C-terminal domain [Clostridium frigoris]
MIKINQKQNCSGCSSCVNACPKHCIEMVEDNEGFLYPQVDVSKCIDCGLCERACPIINKVSTEHTPTAYACINKNENIRLQSSSGGVFTIIAENVINNGGVVFGAAFDDKFNLVHIYTNTILGISKFRGSKYLQSKIGDTYNQTKEFLGKGTKVLFSGTPCQISGLLSYIGRPDNNLICMDIICHGVPSPKVFRMYRTKLEKQHCATTRRITFKCKDSSWKNYSISLLFSNNKEYKKVVMQDIFMKGFLQNLYLRPSCYDCKSKSLNRLSDITIGDFWGIENIVPELDDDKGTSLILVNSDKGKTMFNQLRDKMILKQVNCDEAIKYNSSAIESVPINSKRDKFFKNLDSRSDDISELISKYTKISFFKRVYRKMGAILSKEKRKLLK